MAGALFIASPTLVSRGRGALQPDPAAALPLFLWSLCVCLIAVAPAMRCSSARRRRSRLLGCLLRDLRILMGTFVVGWRFTAVRWDGGGLAWGVLVRGFDAVIVFTSAAIVWRLLHGPALLVLGPMATRSSRLHTATLVLLVSGLTRAWLTWRPVPILQPPAGRLGDVDTSGPGRRRHLPAVAPAGAHRHRDAGRNRANAGDHAVLAQQPTRCGSAVVPVPNPNHPWLAERTKSLVDAAGIDGFPGVRRLFFTGCARRDRARGAARRSLPRVWLGFTGFFVLLSLGPFIHVAGVNTSSSDRGHCCGWCRSSDWFARRGDSRSSRPSGCRCCLGLRLTRCFATECPAAGRTLACRCGCGWSQPELAPVPRQLYSAAIPAVYQTLGDVSENRAVCSNCRPGSATARRRRGLQRGDAAFTRPPIAAPSSAVICRGCPSGRRR